MKKDIEKLNLEKKLFKMPLKSNDIPISDFPKNKSNGTELSCLTIFLFIIISIVILLIYINF